MGLPLKWPPARNTTGPKVRVETELPAGGDASGGCCAAPAPTPGAPLLRCPQCGLPRDGLATRCPRCNAALLVPNSCNGACSRCTSGCSLRL